MTGKKFHTFSAVALGLAALALTTTPADARRGGSFGSRGTRTAVAPPTTMTAPKRVAPVQRTMTDRQAAQPSAQPRPGMAGPSRPGGLAKGILGGLLAGGLVAMLLGGGLGALGGAGLVTALLQALLIGGLIWLALRLFRRRPTFAAAGDAGGAGAPTFTANPFSGAQPSGFGGATGAMAGGYAAAVHDLAITQADKETFEYLLGTVQQAFSREDYAALRACTTPEIMSYLAEELSANATQGLRNEVLGTELLDAEVAQAWSEHDADYATIAMHYQSIDVMRSRTTGAVVDGDPSRLTRTTELWTFVRDRGHPWRLSAIQEA